MAHLSVLGSHSVNGVAEIHSQILKDSTLHQFYTCFPHRFSNKTNGISHRRWLIEANPKLASLIDDTIGDKWRKTPSRLADLMAYKDDASFKEPWPRSRPNGRNGWPATFGTSIIRISGPIPSSIFRSSAFIYTNARP